MEIVSVLQGATDVGTDNDAIMRWAVTQMSAQPNGSQREGNRTASLKGLIPKLVLTGRAQAGQSRGEEGGAA